MTYEKLDWAPLHGNELDQGMFAGLEPGTAFLYRRRNHGGVHVCEKISAAGDARVMVRSWTDCKSFVLGKWKDEETTGVCFLNYPGDTSQSRAQRALNVVFTNIQEACDEANALQAAAKEAARAKEP